MLSHPYNTSLSPVHTTSGNLNFRPNGRTNIQRTSSVSSLLFTRRPSTASSLAGVSNQLSPLHQRDWHRPAPAYSSNSITDLDHCFGGSGGGSGTIRRCREEQRDVGQDLYDFLKSADLEEYYTVFSKHLKVCAHRACSFLSSLHVLTTS